MRQILWFAQVCVKPRKSTTTARWAFTFDSAAITPRPLRNLIVLGGKSCSLTSAAINDVPFMQSFAQIR